MYFVIEGIDRAGKSTIIEELKKLEPFASQTKFVQEPFNKKVFEGVDPEDWRKNTLLFASQRTKINHLILKAPRLISDRSIISNLAYQGVNKGRREWILQVNNFVPLPNICFILDIDPNIALKRIGSNNDELSHFEDIEFLYGVRDRYLHKITSELNYTRFYIMQAKRPPQKLVNDIINVITDFETNHNETIKLVKEVLKNNRP